MTKTTLGLRIIMPLFWAILTMTICSNIQTVQTILSSSSSRLIVLHPLLFFSYAPPPFLLFVHPGPAPYSTSSSSSRHSPVIISTLSCVRHTRQYTYSLGQFQLSIPIIGPLLLSINIIQNPTTYNHDITNDQQRRRLIIPGTKMILLLLSIQSSNSHNW
jgi:hypothetical protein